MSILNWALMPALLWASSGFAQSAAHADIVDAQGKKSGAAGFRASDICEILKLRPDGSEQWLGNVESRDMALFDIEVTAAKLPGKYAILNRQTGEREVFAAGSDVLMAGPIPVGINEPVWSGNYVQPNTANLTTGVTGEVVLPVPVHLNSGGASIASSMAIPIALSAALSAHCIYSLCISLIFLASAFYCEDNTTGLWRGIIRRSYLQRGAHSL